MIVGTSQTWFDSDYLARIYSGRLQLFRISQGRCVIDFGRVAEKGFSVEMSVDDRYCVLGAYDFWGVACFEAATGKEVWRRKDLKRVQHISCGIDDSCAFVSCEKTGAQQVELKSGATLNQFRGVRDVYASPLSETLVLGNRKSICLSHIDGTELNSVGLKGFGILDVAWSPDAVVISEAKDHDAPKNGVVRCFSVLTGEMLWSYTAERHVVRPISYRPAKNAFVGVDYRSGPNDRLLIQWDADTGRIMWQREIPASSHHWFCHRGEAMLLSVLPDPVVAPIDEVG